MNTKTHGYAASAAKGLLQPFEFDLGELGPEEVEIKVTHCGICHSDLSLVLEAFDTLFNKRDYVAAQPYWSSNYIQHSAHIAPGREGLFNLIKNIPSTLKYEPGVIVADGDFVIVHGRFSGFGQPVNWIVADIVRIENGILVEHWDCLFTSGHSA